MIARTHRFHGHGSLKGVYGRGQTVRSGQLALKYALNPRRSTYRVAVVVGRKVSKSAVVRNRIRRRIYAVVGNHAGQLEGAHDLVFTVFSEQIKELAPNRLDELVAGQLRAAGALKTSKTIS